MNDRKKEFDELCEKKASDFEFAWNGFVRIYENRESKLKKFSEPGLESCLICKNEKVTCVCMGGDE